MGSPLQTPFEGEVRAPGPAYDAWMYSPCLHQKWLDPDQPSELKPQSSKSA